MPKRFRRMGRRALVLVVIGLLAGVFVRWFLIQGLIVPVRVASGSMADRLYGPHGSATCVECRFPFRCTADAPPEAGQAVCPNCGHYPVPVADRQEGQRVLIDRWSYRQRAPRRWEIVAFRQSSAPERFIVKRVVGLPGETLSIHQGDVFLDGRRLQKDLPHFLAMAIPVHDDAFRRRDSTLPLSRWRGAEHRANQWSITPEGHVWRADGETGSDVPSEPSMRSDPGWLRYHHWSCLPPPSDPRQPAPISDNYGTNQGLSRPLYWMRDIGVTGQVHVVGLSVSTTIISWQLNDGHHQYIVDWDPGNRRLELLADGSRVATASTRDVGPLPSGQHAFCLVRCDGRILFALGGTTWFRHPCPPDDSSPFEPSVMPVSIGATGSGQLEVNQLVICRDVYYTHPHWEADPWPMGPLGPAEYLLLGDNSPISRDGRHGKEHGVIDRSLLHGRVLANP